MTVFSNIIAGINEDGEANVPDAWLQGRTTYGGLSAALCVAGALRAIPDLPPLRSAQFSFIGPAAGPMRIVPTILRQGKNTVFVGCDLQAETGLATRAILAFGAARPSTLRYLARPAPAVPPPADCPDFFPGPRPNFTQQFEILRAGGPPIASGAPDPKLMVWFRHRDEAARRGIIGFIALADAIPPAAFSMFTAPAQISTVTWSIDILNTEHAYHGTPGGWHLMQSQGDHVADGYTSQEMSLWNEDRVPVLMARQTIAIFV